MAPQSCVMNPAQGSPPSAAPGETSPEDRAAGGMGTDELDLSPVRRCKTKTVDLPFSVESLISDRTPARSLHSPEPGLGCVRPEDTECAPPSGLYQSKAETVDLSDKETSPWLQAPYTSPPSECRLFSFSFLGNMRNFPSFQQSKTVLEISKDLCIIFDILCFFTELMMRKIKIKIKPLSFIIFLLK